MKKIEIYDSTLRDGAQGENVNFSVMDKINITLALDELGVDYIEAGNPFSNPKDVEFFKKANDLTLKKSKLVAFGSTIRVGAEASQDKGVLALASTPVKTAAIFGKSWDMHVTEVLKTTLDENIRMISETIRFLCGKGKDVFFDAEHYFDGYKANSDYAIKVLEAAQNAGAAELVLCDTNGGCFPEEIEKIVSETAKKLSVPLSIHCHNDTGCAVANSIAAVNSGAVSVQGTFNGIGERCGNTCLSTIIANLSLKLGFKTIPEENIKHLTSTARCISELSNLHLADSSPYVGKSAFAHKGGMHIDGVVKVSSSFEHIKPECVGNERQFLLSEVSGRQAVLSKLKPFAPEITRDSEEMSAIVETIKIQEHRGYQYEGAQASFELLVHRLLGNFKEFFSIEFFKIIGEQNTNQSLPSTAMIKIRVGDETAISADEGNGPVNALDKAMRNALRRFYPDILDCLHLTDYKVRVVDTSSGTAAAVRVLIETTDGVSTWTTVGASTDVINASVKALTDSVEYKLMKSGYKIG